MGQGVEDRETFASLLAPEMSGARVVNLGVAGYTALHSWQRIEAHPADAVVWLLSNNDAEATQTPSLNHQPQWSAVSIYGFAAWALQHNAMNAPLDLATYDSVLAQARADARVLVFATERDPHPPDWVTRIPEHGAPISKFDGHPSPEGHRRFADAMRQAVLAHVAVRCDAAAQAG